MNMHAWPHSWLSRPKLLRKLHKASGWRCQRREAACCKMASLPRPGGLGTYQ